MTATRTSTASADGPARPTPPPAAIGLLGIMQALYDDMLPGITERQAGYAREIADRARPAGGRRGRAARSKTARTSSGSCATSRTRTSTGCSWSCSPTAPAMRVAARCSTRTGCRSAWPTSSPSPASRPSLGHGRPHLQPGHPRSAGHRQRDGAGRPAVPRASPTTGRPAPSATPWSGWARAARAVTAWRTLQVGDLRLRDERAWATSASTRTRCCARSGRRSTLRRARRPVARRGRRCRRRRRPTLIAEENERFEIDPALSDEEREDHARMQIAHRARSCATRGYRAYSTHFDAIAEDGRFARLPLAAASTPDGQGLRLRRRRATRSTAALIARRARAARRRRTSPRCTRWTSPATRSS